MSNVAFNALFLLSVGIIPGLIVAAKNGVWSKSRSPLSFLGMLFLYVITGPGWLAYIMLTVPINILRKAHYLSAAYWGNNKKDMFEKMRNVYLLETKITDTIERDDTFNVVTMLLTQLGLLFFYLFALTTLKSDVSSGTVWSEPIANFFRSIVSTVGQVLVQIVS